MQRFLLTASLVLPQVVLGQVASGISLDSDRLRVDETVTVVVNFEAASRWCGLRLDFGDGDVRDLVVEDFPLSLAKQYASAGRYVIRAAGRALPRGLLSVLPCTGRARTAVLTVADTGRDKSSPVRPDENEAAQAKEIKEKQRERHKRAEELSRERHKRADELERQHEKRDREERRERAKREGEANRQRPVRASSPVVAPAPAPAPARTRAPAPAPAASKPHDGSLKVF